MSSRDGAVYVFLAIVWGHSFLLLLHVVEAFGWGASVSLRALVAGLTLVAFSYLKGDSFQISQHWKDHSIVGVTAVAVFLAGMSYATPIIGTAMSAILVSTIPLFSLCIGWLWGTEGFTVTKLIGLSLGIVGIVLLVGFPDQPLSGEFIIGCIVSIVGSMANAFGSNYASRHMASVPSIQVAYGSFIVGGVLTLPLLLVVPIPALPGMLDWGYLLIAGCVMSAMTYVVYFDLIKRIGATRTVSVEFAVTLIAVLLGALYLGESLTNVQLAGAVSVFAGCLLVLGFINLKPRREVIA
jgi:drug/metabolite transporter (DMT)-like permease